MIFLLQHLFLLAIDLLLAMSLSCLFYAFVCISITFLTCFIIIISSGIVERSIDVKGRAIVILTSNGSIGRMFTRNLDKAGFRVSAAHWPPREEGTTTEEERSSRVKVAQLHMTEDEYQKTVKTFIENHLSLKVSSKCWYFFCKICCNIFGMGCVNMNTHHQLIHNKTIKIKPKDYIGMYGLMKKPSILIWEEEEPDTCRLPEKKNSLKWKKVFKAPALCLAVLFCSLNCALTFLKKRSLQIVVPLLKSKH